MNPQQPYPQQPPQYPPPYQPPPRKKSNAWWIILLCLAPFAICIVGVGVGVVNRDTKSSPTTKIAVTDTNQATSTQSAAKESAAAAAAAAERARQTDKTQYTAISDRDWQLVAKDPSSYIGKKYVIYGTVRQFDSATGTESLRADTAGSNQDESYDYDINTIVEEGIPGALRTIVEKDELQMYVRVDGSQSYTTTMGGSVTVPQVSVYVVVRLI